MGEREREKDRARAYSDASMGSLWIDYILLPRKLEEHLGALASGSDHGPLPADLIIMFLEQVLVNHKAILANSSSVGKDAVCTGVPVQPRLSGFHAILCQDDQSSATETSKMVRKTTALLCERAARVAVLSNFSLADIETAIPSQQHQFLLLRALMDHDKIRLLLHVCNLHRWRVHNALHTHFLGSSAINGPSSCARLNSWTIEEDLADLFRVPESGSSRIIESGTGDSKGYGTDEENPSVEFLERIFYGDRYPITRLDVMHRETDIQLLQSDDNGAGTSGNAGYGHPHQMLSNEYRCQALFDVAEVHFMRGRIERALDVFTLCGELFAGLPSPRTQSGDCSQEQLSFGAKQNLTFPKARLAGFIVACRMLLAKCAATQTHLEMQEKSNISKAPLPELGAPSPVQSAVIACEQSRWYFTNRALPHRHRRVSDLHKVENAKDVTRPKRCREGSYFGLCTSKRRNNSILPVKAPSSGGESVTWLHQMKVEETIQHPANGLLGGDFLVAKGTSLSVSEGSVDLDGSQTQSIRPVKENGGIEKMLDANSMGHSESSKEDTIYLNQSVITSSVNFPATPEGKKLVQTFVDDLLNGFLSWGYCLSLEKDPRIPTSIQCELAACNVVREVAEGAPVESFLRISQRLKADEKGMGFCLRLVYRSRSLKKITAISWEEMILGRNKPYRALQIQTPTRETWQQVIEGESMAQRMDKLAFYMCCVIDKPWCWALATELGFAAPSCVSLPGLSGRKRTESEESIGSGNAHSFIVDRISSGILKSQQREELLLGLLLADSVADYEVIVSRAKRLLPTGFDVRKDLHIVGKESEHCHEQMQESSARISCSASFSSPIVTSCCDNVLHTACGTVSYQCLGRPTFGADMSAFLRRKAFDTLENLKDVGTAKRLYELAVVMDPNDTDSELMLWLVEKLIIVENIILDKPSKQYLSDLSTDSFPSFSLVEYVLQCLIEQEFWVHLAELCQWGITKLNAVALRESDMMTMHNVGTSRCPVSSSPVSVVCKKQLQTLKVATALGDLMPLCGAILAAASRNDFTEDGDQLRSTSWQLFEEFLSLLAGVGTGNPTQGGDLRRPPGPNIVVAPIPPYSGVKSVHLISRIRNPRVLTTLASLTAGWLHRCHAAGLTPWALAFERYGLLAAVTAGASLPPPVGSLPHAAAVYRPVPSKVSPEFGRDLFRDLLEGIIALPEVTEGNEEKGHCWFQGLADLAYEDEAYVKALQFYIQAGGIRSAHYCNPSSSMPRDVFSVWVIRRMINACRAIGAGLQAAILCQCLPQPDYEAAFRLLQEHSPILDTDAAAYFQCVWEVPILELLVHLHEKAGEGTRVDALISYLQHPAMNVHNPQSIRKAHICAMEQLFLQRLSEELLG